MTGRFECCHSTAVSVCSLVAGRHEAAQQLQVGMHWLALTMSFALCKLLCTEAAFHIAGMLAVCGVALHTDSWAQPVQLRPLRMCSHIHTSPQLVCAYAPALRCASAHSCATRRIQGHNRSSSEEHAADAGRHRTTAPLAIATCATSCCACWPWHAAFL